MIKDVFQFKKLDMLKIDTYSC